jgi:hypothetical protein
VEILPSKSQADFEHYHSGDLGGTSIFIVTITVVSDYAEGVPQLPPGTPGPTEPS